MADSSMYYDLNPLLSRNKLLNFVMGNRGGGKTFACKQWAINGWLKKHKQFIYLRRYATEFDDINLFFNDIKFMFPDHTFDVQGDKRHGGRFYIDNELAGYYIPLSTSNNKKSVPYPDVDKIIFDEFVIRKTGTQHYINKEAELFLEFFSTVARSRDDVRAVLVGNAISIVNPYFLYFNIRPKVNSHFVSSGQCCLEMYKNDEFVEMMRKTKFGQLIDNTQYGRYNIDNEFLMDNDQFIEKLTGRATCWCCIIYNDTKYYVWYCIESGMLHFCKKQAPNGIKTYAITTSDHAVNMMLISSVKSTALFRDIRTAYEYSQVRFDNQESKQAFYEIMQFV